MSTCNQRKQFGDQPSKLSTSRKLLRKSPRRLESVSNYSTEESMNWKDNTARRSPLRKTPVGGSCDWLRGNDPSKTSSAYRNCKAVFGKYGGFPSYLNKKGKDGSRSVMEAAKEKKLHSSPGRQSSIPSYLDKKGKGVGTGVHLKQRVVQRLKAERDNYEKADISGMKVPRRRISPRKQAERNEMEDNSSISTEDVENTRTKAGIRISSNRDKNSHSILVNKNAGRRSSPTRKVAGYGYSAKDQAKYRKMCASGKLGKDTCRHVLT